MKKLLLSILTITAFSFGTSAQYNQAFHTDYLSNSCVIVPTTTGSNLLFSGSFTIEAWVHLSNFAGGSVPQYHIVESYGGSTGGYALRYESGYYKFYKLNGASSDGVSSGTFYNATGYPTHHVSATYDATTNELKIYVNGVLEGTAVTTMTDPIQQNNMYIGAQGDGGSVHRNTGIDDVRIWGVVKTQTEIQNSMNSCLTGSETDLLAHYTFDDTNTSSILDNTSNGNDGTISSFNASTSYVAGILECCTINVPDANFKAYLVGNTAINTNSDTEIQCSEASAYTGQIICSGQSIADLTGIEAFTAITQLHCNGNSLTSLDVTQNVNISQLTCSSNQLTSIDLSQNIAITLFDCSTNSIGALDLTQNTNLVTAICASNQLTSINVLQNSVLDYLRVDNNQLAALDLSGNSILTYLKFKNNQITNVDLSQNTLLETLLCENNSLTSLDVSLNTALVNLRCGYNQLTTFDATQNYNLNTLYTRGNQLTSLNVANGNNTNFVPGFFISSDNPNLSCIQVDDAAYSATNWTNIDPASSFSTDCTVWNDIKEEVSADITIYPNPASSQITITSDSPIEAINIYNVFGSLVKQENTATFSVENLANGVYMMNIKTNNGNSYSRFIKE